jgi:hypothetical protein
MKIRPVGAEFNANGLRVRETDRWTKGQTDMTKLIVAFHNFFNASKSNTGATRFYCSYTKPRTSGHNKNMDVKRIFRNFYTPCIDFLEFLTFILSPK